MSEITPINPCFEDIIGLSRIDCGCFEDNLYMTSNSTLYLDEAEGLNLRTIDSIKNCDNANDLWLLMDTARNNGISRFISDTNIALIQKYAPQRSNYKGTVGEQTYKVNRGLTTAYAGVRMRTANVVGGFMKITNIKTIFSGTDIIQLFVYNNLNELLHTINLNTTSNSVTTNQQSITLPMWDKRTQELEYIFIYAYDSLNQPKDNQLSCNCGGVTYPFNCQYPYFHSPSNKMKGWSKWIMPGNIETDTLDFSDLSCTSGNYMNGLTFDISFWCDLSRQFCFDEADLNDRQFISVAYAILHISAYYLCTQILTSPNISRYTMINHEQLNALRQLHEAKYKELITYLVETTDITNTDCLTCKNNIRIGKALL